MDGYGLATCGTVLFFSELSKTTEVCKGVLLIAKIFQNFCSLQPIVKNCRLPTAYSLHVLTHLSPKSCPSLFFLPANTRNKIIPIKTIMNTIGNMVSAFTYLEAKPCHSEWSMVNS